MKICFKCEGRKPLSEFYKHAAMADGHLNKCKECTKSDVTQHRLENIDRIREYDRKRGSRRTTEDQRAWRAKNPEKAKAHRAVNYHVRKGTLTKAPCEVCGDESVHAHHDDYSKPLDVRWLCAAHHHQHHRRGASNDNDPTAQLAQKHRCEV